MSDSHDQIGFVAPDPAELAPLFPGYEIQSLVATGGMGAVYAAVQKSLDRMVALKILPRELSSDAAFCAGFEAEAKAMARLNHPNLIGVYDFGEVNGMLFIIMEFVAGQSVYHATYGHAVDPKEVIRLISGVCHGLAHAHENGIIHRDIKPSNILLDLNGLPKIGDFGLARPAERKVEEGEEIFGTPHYTAPEVVNSPHSVDHRADIFSVGVFLHELLTGQLPAADPRPASVIAKCDARFDAIIRKATQPLPAARYSNAADIAKDLEAIGNSTAARRGPVVAPAAVPRRPKAGGRTYTSSAPQQSSNGVMIVVGILVLGAGAFFLMKPGKEPEKKPDAVVVAPPPPKEEVRPSVPTRSAQDDLPPVQPNRPVQPTGKTTAFGSTEPPVVEGGDVTGTRTRPSEPDLPTPKFDVAGFYDRARKIMQERAKSQLSTYRTGVKSNFSDFKISIDKQTRRMKLNGTRVDETVARDLAAMQEAGGIIPARLPAAFDDIMDIDTIHSASLTRQTGIEDTADQSLSQYASTYILGLEKQIERLDPAEDPGAVGLIQREIKRTKEEPGYFPKLMRGVDPDADDDY